MFLDGNGNITLTDTEKEFFANLDNEFNLSYLDNFSNSLLDEEKNNESTVRGIYSWHCFLIKKLLVKFIFSIFSCK